MTIEEAIAYFINTNEGVVLAAKDANVYNYENQQIKAVCMRRTFEANKMAIASLEAWEKVKAEIDAHREKLKTMADDDWYAGKIRGYDCTIEIIDKYKASSAGAEGRNT